VNDSTRVVGRPRARWPRPARTAAAIIAVAAVAQLAVACGGGSSSITSSSTAAYLPGALHFAQCMRSHRVIDFPDPDSQGGFPNFGRPGLPKESDQVVNSAMRACAHLWQGAVTPAKRTEMDLYFARCMRDDGYPDTPDSGDFSAFPQRVINSAHFISTLKACVSSAHKQVLGTGDPFMGPP
jgi:hypothetical protein